MKQILTLAIAVLCCALCSCESDDNLSRLKKSIAATNSRCPMSLGMMGDMLSITYDDNAREVKYVLRINEDYAEIDKLTFDRGLTIKMMKLSISGRDEMLNELIEAEVGLNVTCKWISTGQSFNYALTLDELKEIKNNPISESERNQILLHHSLALENADFPCLVVESIEALRVYDDGANIIYLLRMDENIYDFDMAKSVVSEMKQDVAESLKDLNVKAQLNMIRSLNKGLIYRYTGSISNKSFDIAFTNDELYKF